MENVPQEFRTLFDLILLHYFVPYKPRKGVDLFPKRKEQWEKRFLEYKRFKKKFKREPQETDRHMGIASLDAWCQRQRVLFREKRLTEDAFKRMHALDFNWNLEGGSGRRYGAIDIRLRKTNGYKKRFKKS